MSTVGFVRAKRLLRIVRDMNSYYGEGYKVCIGYDKKRRGRETGIELDLHIAKLWDNPEMTH